LSHDQRERMPGTCGRMSADGRSRAYIADSIHSDRHGANVGPFGARGGTQRAKSCPQTSATALASRDRAVTRKIIRPLRRVQRAELVVAAAGDPSRAPNALKRRSGTRPSKIGHDVAGGNSALSKSVVSRVGRWTASTLTRRGWTTCNSLTRLSPSSWLRCLSPRHSRGRLMHASKRKSAPASCRLNKCLPWTDA
jgi:hypothetical protein